MTGQIGNLWTSANETPEERDQRERLDEMADFARTVMAVLVAVLILALGAHFISKAIEKAAHDAVLFETLDPTNGAATSEGRGYDDGVSASDVRALYGIAGD